MIIAYAMSTANTTSSWLQLDETKVNEVSIMTDWTGVTGAGDVKIYGSLDKTSKTLIATVTISTASNLTDSTLTYIQAPFRYLQAVYTKGTVSAGTLNVKALVRGR
jgi:hypothetical protein